MCATASCAWGNRCSDAPATEIQALEKLPAALEASLGPHGGKAYAIADRGAQFNATDVANLKLPMRRFTLAAITPTCAVVAIEFGGIAHGFQLTQWKLDGAVWKSMARIVVLHEPTSLSDLLTW